MNGEPTTHTPAAPGAGAKPAFYATGRGRGGWRDWLSLLHPPYTAWHLSYVAIGATLAHPLHFDRLGYTLLAFFLGLGVGAHALDEMNGSPLHTGIERWQLLTAAIVSIAGAALIGWFVGGLRLVPFIVVGAVLAFGYNLEWFGGALHNGVGLAFAWGAFPMLTSYFAQNWTISIAAVVAALAAFFVTLAQRALSTPARWLRRSVQHAELTATLPDGATTQLSSSELLKPLESALKAISWGMVALAIALVLARR
jgi:hypothetical protein